MRIWNSDSRRRSAVGRISRDDGDARLRPFNRPPTTRIRAHEKKWRGRALRSLPPCGGGLGRGVPHERSACLARPSPTLPRKGGGIAPLARRIETDGKPWTETPNSSYRTYS